MATRGRVARVAGAAAGAAAGVTTALGLTARRERRRVGSLWASLEAERGTGALFDPASLGHLPATARRYVTHAIAPGTPLAARAVIEMHGEIRLDQNGDWLRFRAREVISPRRGLVSRIDVRRGPTRLRAVDDYAADSAHTRRGLLGLFPVVRDSGGPGSDVARSARGRLLAESCWVPSVFVDETLHWEPVGGDHVNVVVAVDDEPATLCLYVGPRGELRRTVISRRGDVAGDGSWADIPFATTVDEERTFGGYTIPSRVRTSWWPDEECEFEFFRVCVDGAEFA